MREIKYQGWNGKQLLQVVRIHLDADGAIWWSNDFKQLKIYNAEHNPMRQYIGLKDKNGKEIFEGDVSIYPNGNAGYGDRTQPDYLNYVIHSIEELYADDALYFELTGGEIIGNIYENPELTPLH